jgi:hypothetical protein
MVRMLNHELGVSLKLAANAADRVLTSGLAPNRIRISASRDRSMALHLDLDRFLSTANAALAAAYAFAPSRGPGRPKKQRRHKSAVDESSMAWEIGIEDNPEELSRLAQQLREWQAYPRGIERGLPFIMDVATLRAVPRLALVTTRGEVDVVISEQASTAGSIPLVSGDQASALPLPTIA